MGVGEAVSPEGCKTSGFRPATSNLLDLQQTLYVFSQVCSNSLPTGSVLASLAWPSSQCGYPATRVCFCPFCLDSLDLSQHPQLFLQS